MGISDGDALAAMKHHHNMPVIKIIKCPVCGKKVPKLPDGTVVGHQPCPAPPETLVCSHDRDAAVCPYCPLMRKTKRHLFDDVTALPDNPKDEDDEEIDPVRARRSEGGRPSLDEWEDTDTDADGRDDLYRRGVLHSPRETGEQDPIDDLKRNMTGDNE
jgi:hypothetical protein